MILIERKPSVKKITPATVLCLIMFGFVTTYQMLMIQIEGGDTHALLTLLLGGLVIMPCFYSNTLATFWKVSVLMFSLFILGVFLALVSTAL